MATPVGATGKLGPDPVSSRSVLVSRRLCSLDASLFRSSLRPELEWHRHGLFAKAAINELPWDGNTADMTGDKSEGNHSRACNQTKRDDPFVAYRIAVRSDEQNSEHKVGTYRAKSALPVITTKNSTNGE